MDDEFKHGEDIQKGYWIYKRRNWAAFEVNG